MQTVSEGGLPALDPAGRGWKKPWGRSVGKIRGWLEKQHAALRRRRLKRALVFFRIGVRAWRSAESIPAEDRTRLEDRFRDAWRTEYRRRFVEQRLGWLFQSGILLGWVAYFAVLPLTVPRRYRGADYIDTLTLALTGSLLVILAGGLIVGWISRYLNGSFATVGTSKEAAGGLLILLLFTPVVYFAGRSSADPVMMIVLGLTAWGVVFVAVTGLAWVALTVATNWVRRRSPDALLAAALFGACDPWNSIGIAGPTRNFVLVSPGTSARRP